MIVKKHLKQARKEANLQVEALQMIGRRRRRPARKAASIAMVVDGAKLRCTYPL